MNRSATWGAALKDGRTARLRHLRTGDGPPMAEFFDSLGERERHFFWPYELDDDTACRIAAEADSAGQLTLVAVEPTDDGERVLGYAFVVWRAPRPMPSLGICLRPGWQSAGLGGQLMGRLLDCCRAEGLRQVCLTVHKDNERAQRLYRSMGFEIVGEQLLQYQGIMQWRMEVTL